ncbi:MAG: LamG domain-containing protein, partial [Betaproteobacteria bacterium]|nr:LamG domain-containing protein [Betaproteobacteria bacterium]
MHSTAGAPLDGVDPATNRSLLVDGGTTYVTAGTAPALEATTQLTVEAWIRPTGNGTDGTYGGIIVNREGEYEIARFADGSIAWAFANGSPGWNWVNTGYVAALNEWTHIAVVYDNARVDTYANGELVHSYQGSGAIGDTSPSQEELRVGSRQGTEQDFVGNLDEVRVWTVARTAEQIAAHYRAAMPETTTGLAAAWHFDEATGKEYADASGNGITASITNVPARETHLYRFAATAGERLYFDLVSKSGANLTLRLFDPFGALISGPAEIGDVDVFTAQFTGDYLVAIEGRVTNTGSAAYEIAVHAAEDAEAELAVGERAESAIASPGERVRFTFDLADPARLLFDSLTNNSNLYWSLSGPRGVEVSGRAMSQSDASAGNPLLDLAAGSYVLTVDGAGDTTGEFAFRLLDLAGAQELAKDVDVEGTLDPANTTVAYRFEAASGDQFTFDRKTLSGSTPYWRLLDPTGRTVFGPTSFQDVANVTALIEGTYTLLLEGTVGAGTVSSYTFAVTSLGNTPVAEFTGTEMSLGNRVDGTLSAAGEVDSYVFTIDAPALVVMDSLAPNNNSSFRWRLLSARGQEVDARSLYNSESYELGSPNPVVPLVMAGTYQIQISATGSTTGAYAFRLLDLADATEILPGEVKSADFNPANESDVYRFDVPEEGGRYFLDMRSLSHSNTSWLSWRLFDPWGRQVFGPVNFSDVDVFQLDVAGTYTLLAEPRVWTTQYYSSVSYSFVLQEAADASESAISLGEVVDGEIAQAGDQVTYTFDVAGTSLVYFDALTNNSSVHWSLTGPRGSLVLDRSFTSSDSVDGLSVMELREGTYRLTIDGSGDAAGAFRFRLADLDDATELILGAQIEGTLDASNATALYRFEAESGDRIYLDYVTRSGDIRWRLLDPWGRAVFGSSNFNTDGGELTLAYDGTYTLALEGRINNTTTPSTYTFKVQDIEDVEVGYGMGDTALGTIEHAGQRVIYHFDVAQATTALFDALNEQPSVLWSLTGPRGVLVSGRSLTGSDSWEVGGNPLLELASGSYTLTIDGSGDFVGAYAFRLLDAGTASDIQVLEVIDGVLGDAAIGVPEVRLPSTVPMDDPADAGGALDFRTWNRYVTIPDDASLRPQQLTLEAWVNRGAAASTWDAVAMKSSNSSWNDGYGLAIYPDGRLHFFINNYNNVEISTPLAVDTWTHVAGTYDGATLRLYVNGEEVASRVYSGTINHTTQPLLLGQGAGGYPWRGMLDEVRLWNVARSAEDIAANYRAAIVGSHEGLIGRWGMDEPDYDAFVADGSFNFNDGYLTNFPAVETKLYRFEAQAGERFYFDRQILAGDNFTVRLFDPVGNLVSGPQWFNDIDVFTAQFSGKYLIALEGRIYHDSPSIYRFALNHVDDAAGEIAVGEQLDGSLDHAGQKRTYTFSLDDTRRIYVDALTGQNAMRWTLAGPQGTLVSSRPFDQTDSYAGSSILDLIAGDYTLTVDGSADTTGAFSIRLLDVGQATEFQFDETVTGLLDPTSGTHIYRFEATDGDNAYFDSLNGNPGNTYWRLLDPFGRVVSGANYIGGDAGRMHFSATGWYTMLVEGGPSPGNGNYSFRFVRTVNTERPMVPGESSNMSTSWTEREDGSALVLDGLHYVEVPYDSGASLAGSATWETWLRVDGIDNTWTPIFFQGEDGDYRKRTFSLWLHSNGMLYMSMGNGVNETAVGTAGGTIQTGQWYHVAAVVDREAQTMRIVVDGTDRAQQTSNVLTIGWPSESPLYLGTTTEGSTGYSHLRGAVDDMRVWNVARTTQQIAESMNALAQPAPAGLIGEWQFDEPGGHVIADTSGHGRDATVQDLTFGIVKGRIELPGYRTLHTFTLDSATRLYFDSLWEVSNLRWSLTG